MKYIIFDFDHFYTHYVYILAANAEVYRPRFTYIWQNDFLSILKNKRNAKYAFHAQVLLLFSFWAMISRCVYFVLLRPLHHYYFPPASKRANFTNYSLGDEIIFILLISFIGADRQWFWGWNWSLSFFRHLLYDISLMHFARTFCTMALSRLAHMMIIDEYRRGDEYRASAHERDAT